MKNGLILTMDKFSRLLPALRCPRCHGEFRRESGSLICENGHCYDAAKSGYLNLAGSRMAPGYDKDLFEARRAVFGAGFYEPILAAVEDLLMTHAPKMRRMLDAGCGEGYYTAGLLSRGMFPGAEFFAADLSREAVRMAARPDDGIGYLVADLADLPFKDGCLDVVLDILSPANYAEFSRVLSPAGIIIKAVPGKDYLCEIRSALFDDLAKSEYSNDRVLSRAAEKLCVLSRRHIKYTRPVPPELRAAFFAMTPMSAHTAPSVEDICTLAKITIEMELFAARPARE